MESEEIDFRPKTPAELQAIKSIFKEIDHSFIPLRRPDFRIIRKSDLYSVGVEVTEMYYSESDGNLMNQEGYIERGAGGKIYQKDKGTLWAETIILPERKDESGNPMELKAVAQYTPTVAAQMKRMADQIEGKNRKYRYKTFSFQRLELILYDRRNCFAGFEIDDVGPALFYFINQYNILANPVFDEIYYLGHIGDKDRFIPLRQELAKHRLCLIRHYTGVPNDSTYPCSYDAHIQYTKSDSVTQS